MTIDELKTCRREHFNGLNMTDSDFERVSKLPPPQFRYTARAVEMAVRWPNGTTEWAPLLGPGRWRSIDDPRPKKDDDATAAKPRSKNGFTIIRDKGRIWEERLGGVGVGLETRPICPKCEKPLGEWNKHFTSGYPCC